MACAQNSMCSSRSTLRSAAPLLMSLRFTAAAKLAGFSFLRTLLADIPINRSGRTIAQAVKKPHSSYQLVRLTRVGNTLTNSNRKELGKSLPPTGRASLYFVDIVLAKHRPSRFFRHVSANATLNDAILRLFAAWVAYGEEIVFGAIRTNAPLCIIPPLGGLRGGLALRVLKSGVKMRTLP